MVSYSSNTQKVTLSPQTVHNIFHKFSQLNPSPKTELNYTNEFTLLVAVVLSAQCTDIAVNKATMTLFSIADTPLKMSSLGINGLKQYIRSIGLYNAKAKNIMALSEILEKEYNSQLPHSIEALQKLPGVGRKTANVVANVLWEMPVIPVDTHVFRVANRVGLCHEKTPLATEKALIKTIPESYKINSHHWLILHGRYICKARKPECGKCPIMQWCAFTEKGKFL